MGLHYFFILLKYKSKSLLAKKQLKGDYYEGLF